MKLTRYQFNSLIAVICSMVLALMVIAFGYAYEFGVDPIAEDTDTVSKETDITIETVPFSEIVSETTETESKSTESVETITIFEEESTESEPSIHELTPTYTDSKQATEAAPVVYEEEFPWYTSDYELLARLVWAEARGESFEGQLAVVEVVFNRVESPNFPDTVYDVIYEPGQFTTASSLEYVTPTQTQYDVVTAALRMERVLNNDKCVYFNTGSCCGAYYMTIGNHVFGCE
ncbi:MAG: cell wall hydrolase [Ruminococcaceae bacterium]|nr:cell wall hydrolase [Oscillospiraceae bacterium]